MQTLSSAPPVFFHHYIFLFAAAVCPTDTDDGNSFAPPEKEHNHFEHLDGHPACASLQCARGGVRPFGMHGAPVSSAWLTPERYTASAHSRQGTGVRHQAG